MDSWWLVALSVFVGTLLVFGVIAATVLMDTSWPPLLLVLASAGYFVVFTVRDIRKGKTQPVSSKQQRSHRIVIGFVVVMALIVIWLAR